MAAQGLRDYLQRYVDKPSGGGDGGTAKLKKKKRKGKGKGENRSSRGGNVFGKGIVILDDDVVWYREQDDEDAPEEDGDRPTVIEDVEVKQMHRMEALKTHRPYLSMADDGSGWVTLKDDDCHDSTLQRGDCGVISTKREGFHSPDLSPLRRKKCSVDLSSLRRSETSSSGDSRMSNEAQEVLPPWKRWDSPESSFPRTSRIYPDLSPPRRKRDSPHPELAFNDSSRSRKRQSLLAVATQSRREEDLSPPWKKGAARMSDGTFAGLEQRSDKEVVSEAERKRAAETKMHFELDPSLSGRGAETVFRDKRGRRLEGLEEMLGQQRGEKVKPVEQPLEWGKGLAQKKVSDQNFADLEAEKSKPFARYRDDAELDKSLRERRRWGDPMAHLVKPTTAEPVLEDLGAREEMKASGFIVPQDIPKHSWLKRGIAPPPNRYDIRPGRHWDGVDRSTGFEEGLFKRKNEKEAGELEAYLWSVSDM